MRLFYSLTSPFARKVRLLVQELGMADRISGVTVDPWSDESLRAVNPLCQVPALELDDGSTLFDSALICEYLDALRGARFFPEPGPARWTALRRQVLGDGICDAAIRRRLELNRPEAQRSNAVIARQILAVNSALDAVEADVPEEGSFTIGEVSLVCALAYLDLRFAKDQWREKRPKLAAWYRAICARPAILATAPPSA